MMNNDLWQLMYVWLDSYSGCEYNIDDEINILKDPNIAFINPLSWKLTCESIIDALSDVFDVIDEHETLIPDDLPSANKMKQMFREKFVSAVADSLNDIKRQLHIEQKDISDHRLLSYHVDVMYDLIKMLSTNTIESILDERMFDIYNEENDNALSDLFDISANDLTNMHYTVNSVIEEANLDEEEAFDEI